MGRWSVGFAWQLITEKKVNMHTAKEEVKLLLDKLPDECTLEDVQYHLHVVEKALIKFM